MNDLTIPDQTGASTYLQQLQALACEISLAMDAIAANALSRLQESVARQEMLCSLLAGTARAPRFISDRAVETKIQQASEAIRELNLQYAALLRHSGRSIALLLSLCRTHTGQFQEVRGPRWKRQTWSCEG